MGSTNRIGSGTSALMVGGKIRALRREAGLSLRELGAAVGVSLVQLQRYETGVSPLSTSRLLVISKVLGVRASSLLCDVGGDPAEDHASRRRQEDRELAELFASLSDQVERRAILSIVRAAAARDAIDRTELIQHNNELVHSRTEPK